MSNDTFLIGKVDGESVRDIVKERASSILGRPLSHAEDFIIEVLLTIEERTGRAWVSDLDRNGFPTLLREMGETFGLCSIINNSSSGGSTATCPMIKDLEEAYKTLAIYNILIIYTKGIPSIRLNKNLKR
ncbi:MAG: hypothetical protein F7C81_05465 [Desulfurococcales archaeon]|nr:hypothetical protein [Desulfurococcales archaeon]